MEQNTSNSKLYYSIGEVAAILNVASSVIRFWETEFGTLHSKKNKKGDRIFTPKDIEQLKLIYFLTKEQGFTLDGAKNILKNNKKKTEVKLQVIKHLEEVKHFLSDIKNQLGEGKKSI
jgi:DNA-binding transcriptional MerR regulator